MFPSLTSEDPRVIGGYNLRARLGFGGMGQVYLSFTPGGRAIAIKIVRREYADDPDFRQRFAQEVRAAQRVSGRYTAQLLDAGADAATPWLATEYVPGPTLHSVVRDHGSLPHTAVRQLIAAGATSLQAIHGADVVHRDLTPRNLLLVTDGPRIIDFGIARAIDATHLTLSHTPIGTPSFMAPEQAAGEPVTPAADVFTLGSVTYFAATGRTAFGDGNYLSVLRRVAEVQADLTDCPAELRELVEACLKRDPAERPTTTEIVEMCGGPPRFVPGWLPRPVRGEITARTKAIAVLAKSHATAAPAPSPTGQAQPRRRPGKAQRTPRPTKPARTTPPAGRTRIVAPPSGGAGPTNRSDGRALSRHLKFGAAAIALVLVGMITGVTVTIRLVDEPQRKRDAEQLADAGKSKDSPSPSPGPQGTTSAPAASNPTTGKSPTVQYSKTVRITSKGMDLDRVPPMNAPEPRADSDLEFAAYPEGRRGITGDDPNYATWTGSGVPTPATCTELISTQGISNLSFVKGDVVCVRTGEDRIAVLKIKSIAEEFSDGAMATVTVWTRTEGS